VQQLLLSGASADELARHGVGWVVVESGGSVPVAPLDLPVVHRDDELTLYRVGGDRAGADGRGVMVAAHLLWLATLLVGAVGWISSALASRSASRRA
jgi:hypothetical protein